MLKEPALWSRLLKPVRSQAQIHDAPHSIMASGENMLRPSFYNRLKHGKSNPIGFTSHKNCFAKPDQCFHLCYAPSNKCLHNSCFYTPITLVSLGVVVVALAAAAAVVVVGFNGSCNSNSEDVDIKRNNVDFICCCCCLAPIQLRQ